MKIIRAEHLGMCFGVRDAIELVLRRAGTAPVTVLGDLVHNEAVVADLRRRGVLIAQEPGQVKTTSVMITAHGASEKAMSQARDLKLEVLEATCPLVHVAHRAVKKLVAEGFHPIIVGKAGHVEVRGLTEDLAEFDVVLSNADIDALKERPRFGVAAQTTQPVDRVRHLVKLLRERFPGSEVRFVDTVCQPTKQRQDAAVELGRHSDVVIVIGGARSNNTAELVHTCSRYCARVHHVQSVPDLSEAWFGPGETIGITAGTSTPDATIHAVERWLRELAWRRNEEFLSQGVPGASSDAADLRSVRALATANNKKEMHE